MNTIYRIVWNAVTGRWIVASEFAKGRKKSGTKLRSLAAVSAVVGILATSPWPWLDRPVVSPLAFSDRGLARA